MDKKAIEHLARLARIGEGEREKEKLAGDLQAILAYVEVLKNVKIEDKEFTQPRFQNTVESEAGFTHFPHITGRLRKDKEKAGGALDIIQAEKLLEAAPEKEGGYVKVKNILEK